MDKPVDRMKKGKVLTVDGSTIAEVLKYGDEVVKCTFSSWKLAWKQGMLLETLRMIVVATKVYLYIY